MSPVFTGIVEETGRITGIEPRADAIRLVITAHIVAKGVRKGDSIAVNGCCLTVVDITGRGSARQLHFDLLQETWKRTNLSDAAVGSAVNLERALAVGARLGGHFVTGHIDGTGVIRRWEQLGQDHVLDIAAPAAIRRYVIFKGSIAVDGISLTVAGVIRGGFRIWIIPHTHSVTALNERKVGDRVNLEADLLGKYVEKFAGKSKR
jgi:riboflavin synthase